MENRHQYQWVKVHDHAPFAPRDGAGLLSFGGKMWLLGGWNPMDKENFPKVCNSEVWSSIDGQAWTLELLEAPWEGRHTAGYAVHDGKMWIIGGDCNQGHYQPDIWSSENGVDWILVQENAPWGQRALHHTLAFKGKLWVMGGQTVPGFVPSEPKSIYYNDVWCSVNGRDWERVLDHAPWEARGMIGHFAVLNDRIWILGGGTYDTPEFPSRKFFNDVWSSADGVCWTKQLDHAPWIGRQYHEIAAFDGHLWVMEGYNGEKGNMKDVWYSSDGVQWTELEHTPWLPRHAASVTVHQNALWMIAGNNMTSDVWKLVKT